MDRSKFLDAMGKRVTVGLFKEFYRPDRKFKPITTLVEWKQIFLECRDPSEYEAAMALVGDWEHWLEIRNHPLIKPEVDKWHQELAVKLRSEAIKNMVKHAAAPGGTAAAKWLADKGYVDMDKKKVGRPITREEEKEDSSPVADDMARLGLRVVAGSK